jgi:ssDNA-binding Zn-finger/Zn-ribbon topoisomerase 1
MFNERILEKVCNCPECRNQMKETERREENGAVFVWFECSQPNCKGQWLQKIPLRKMSIA